MIKSTVRSTAIFGVVSALLVPAFATGIATTFVLSPSKAIAADNEAGEKATESTSKNPLTGTTTKTKKYKRNVKNAHGDNDKMNVTEKTKTKKDGTEEKSVNVDADQTTKK